MHSCMLGSALRGSLYWDKLNYTTCSASPGSQQTYSLSVSVSADLMCHKNSPCSMQGTHQAHQELASGPGRAHKWTLLCPSMLLNAISHAQGCEGVRTHRASGKGCWSVPSQTYMMVSCPFGPTSVHTATTCHAHKVTPLAGWLMGPHELVEEFTSAQHLGPWAHMGVVVAL